MTPRFNAYLSFDGNCREAMNFYKECFGGELMVQAVAETAVAAQMPAAIQQQVMHSMLTAGDFCIMGSDMHRGKLLEGNAVSLCIHCRSEEEINTLFARVSAGGTVDEPLEHTFWGALFGAVKDKYGKQWLFNYDKNQVN